MIYTIRNEKLEISVSDYGAEMRTLVHQGRNLLWGADPAYWDECAPNLFPYIGRLTNKQYRYQDEIYSMGNHGFAKQSSFACTQSENSLLFELCADETTLAQYPFRFTLQVEYTLSENTVSIAYRVKNEDDKPMFFGIGGHPGFIVPLEEGLTFEDYQLVFPGESQPKRVTFSDDCFVTGQVDYALTDRCRIPLKHDLFDEDAIVLTDCPREVSIASEKGKLSIQVVGKDFPYWGFWHRPKSDAPYVCIEPWASLPSRKGIIEDLETQDSLICLQEKAERSWDWSISVCEE